MATANGTRGQGRRPGPTKSRQAILDAATRLFSEHGYAATSLRGIAREAGVDVAMIGHFFGSKAGLYGETADWSENLAATIATILDGEPGQVGRRLTASFINQWSTTGWRNPIITLAAAATEDRAAAKILRAFLIDELLVPVLEQLGADRPRDRAGFISSTLVGLGLGRHVLELIDADTIQDETLLALTAPHIQALCTQPLAASPAS